VLQHMLDDIDAGKVAGGGVGGNTRRGI
jgi:hypothetical protein